MISPKLQAVLDEVKDFLDDQSDVVDGADGKPKANRAMALSLSLAEAMFLAAAEGSTEPIGRFTWNRGTK